ncbi:hypothetical protein BGZ70_003164, partial [Mortierella alpina]
ASLVAAQDSGDADDDVDGDFSDSDDYDYASEDDASVLPIPHISPVSASTTTTALLSLQPSVGALPSQAVAPPGALPAASFTGILKPGTASAECSVIADLYSATGPWQFVPDTANCCNAEYPNYSSIRCNERGQIIYIYLAGKLGRGSAGGGDGLMYLLLYYNSLSGPIPSSLTQLPLLILGNLPDSAPGWAKLGTLNLEQNALTGALPSWLTTLPSLHSLAIGHNLFETGDPRPAFTFNVEPGTMGSALPDASVTPANVVVPASLFLESFTRLPRLKQLKLDSLGISGGFPASWQQQMVNLTKLDLSNNSMQGSIPAYLDQFSGLKALLLDHNEFGGSVPSLASLASLSGENNENSPFCIVSTPTPLPFVSELIHK